MVGRRLRVMQSFKHPRPTTNPYIVQLDRALDARPEIEHLRLSRSRALLTHLDVFHLHWPETLIEGSSPWKRLLRRAYLRVLLVKLTLDGTAIVRTAHNVEIPKDATGASRRLLERIEDRADFRILLNPDTRLPWDSPSMVITHGHYVDWFADILRTGCGPAPTPDPDVLGFVGLVRRYKGVEGLIDAFRGTAPGAADMRLRISGNPTSQELAREIRTRAGADRRIDLDLRFLPEADFARAIMGSVGIVLPYRFMHNSGSVLAALSLARPVLVPRTSVNAALRREVGQEWVHLFDGDLCAQDLLDFWHAVSGGIEGVPDLTGRDWSRAGADHVAAYRLAVAQRRLHPR